MRIAANISLGVLLLCLLSMIVWHTKVTAVLMVFVLIVFFITNLFAECDDYNKKVEYYSTKYTFEELREMLKYPENLSKEQKCLIGHAITTKQLNEHLKTIS